MQYSNRAKFLKKRKILAITNAAAKNIVKKIEKIHRQKRSFHPAKSEFQARYLLFLYTKAGVARCREFGR